jgi:hypothetical protein
VLRLAAAALACRVAAARKQHSQHPAVQSQKTLMRQTTPQQQGCPRKRAAMLELLLAALRVATGRSGLGAASTQMTQAGCRVNERHDGRLGASYMHGHQSHHRQLLGELSMLNVESVKLLIGRFCIALQVVDGRISRH